MGGNGKDQPAPGLDLEEQQKAAEMQNAIMQQQLHDVVPLYSDLINVTVGNGMTRIAFYDSVAPGHAPKIVSCVILTNPIASSLIEIIQRVTQMNSSNIEQAVAVQPPPGRIQ